MPRRKLATRPVVDRPKQDWEIERENFKYWLKYQQPSAVKTANAEYMDGPCRLFIYGIHAQFSPNMSRAFLVAEMQTFLEDPKHRSLFNYGQ